MEEGDPIVTADADEGVHGHDAQLDALVERIRDPETGVSITTRKWYFKSYPRCFVGSELVTWLVKQGEAPNREEAVLLGQSMLEAHAFHHVTRDHPFRDANLFYRLREDAFELRGIEESDSTWKSVLPQFGAIFASGDESAHDKLQPTVAHALAHHDVDPGMTKLLDLRVEPLDEHNVKLLDHVHPPAWTDPEPCKRYNMVVIGGGPAGLVTAAGSAGVGAKVALIEKHLLGGDCLNVGCVPSKALLACAKVAHTCRSSAAAFGVRVDGVAVDFPAIMERMRRIRAGIAHHDSAKRFTEELGIDVYFGSPKFISNDKVEVNGKVLRFARACVATGARANVPTVTGLEDTPFLTNESLFNLTELPRVFAIIGAGVVACEMAQAFVRFGSEVHVFARGPRVLSREEEEAAALVQASLIRDGVQLHLNSVLRTVTHSDGTFTITYTDDSNGDDLLTANEVLVAAGRKPNVEGLHLEAAGVKYDRHGIRVNDKLETSNAHVFSAGDVSSRFKFTHMADFLARIVIRNALFFGRSKASALTIPWATYTDPEVAHVGLYRADLEEAGVKYQEYVEHFADNDRAICEGHTEGYCRIFVREGTDKIVGATIVGPHAGDMISEITTAMVHDIGLGALASVIHPYPTHAEIIRKLGDAFNRTRLTTTVRIMFRKLMASRR